MHINSRHKQDTGVQCPRDLRGIAGKGPLVGYRDMLRHSLESGQRNLRLNGPS